MAQLNSNETAQSTTGSKLQPQLKDRSFLDPDHFGLENIRKCLFEYLAVVRPKELNAERKIAQQKPVESVALEEAVKAEAKPVTPTKAGGMVEQSNAVVPFDKNLAQKRQQQN